MITLCASIAGFLTSFIPELLKYFYVLHEKQCKLDLLQKQIDYLKIAKAEGQQNTLAFYEALETKHLYSTYNIASTWINNLNGSVRPVLTYSFFLIYISIKYLQYQAIYKTVYAIEYLDVLWTVDDKVLFAGTLSFYYGNRSFIKLFTMLPKINKDKRNIYLINHLPYHKRH